MSYTKVLEEYSRIHCFYNFLNHFLGLNDVTVIIILIIQNKIMYMSKLSLEYHFMTENFFKI